MGIVYTPVEVVDFIIKSADFALKQEFGVGLTDEGVHILDPFTGTGTFMVRLLRGVSHTPEWPAPIPPDSVALAILLNLDIY
ncbi:hypothetical protein [Dolichospermum sp. LEGE 00246]|uniref:hypothetical protein n=1 Tax=Dolichospermum sp. LEGE 00246 TaxID=1828605 RepID=UPI001D13DAFF|nr:hypothetical protein [Dolichospermum sp. LEGE 00246]